MIPLSGTFRPKLPDDSPNIPKHSLLQEFVALLFGLALIVLLLYGVLGMMVDVAIDYIPPQREHTLFSRWMTPLDRSTQGADERQLQGIVDAMIQRTGIVDIPLRVVVMEHPDANAFAIPGGSIAVTSGLIAQASSANELAMVLGHEIGHFVLRHHLRGMGRGIVMILLSSTLLGVEPEGQSLFGMPLVLARYRHSREQESAADEVGLRLLNALYGHVGGALDFFERLKSKESSMQALALFQTHPPSAARVEALQRFTQSQGYETRSDRAPFLRAESE